jgi:hypothetical protein
MPPSSVITGTADSLPFEIEARGVAIADVRNAVPRSEAHLVWAALADADLRALVDDLIDVNALQQVLAPELDKNAWAGFERVRYGDQTEKGSIFQSSSRRLSKRTSQGAEVHMPTTARHCRQVWRTSVATKASDRHQNECQDPRGLGVRYERQPHSSAGTR